MWEEVFHHGNDFFDDLAPLFPAGWRCEDRASVDAARRKWAKIGAMFLRDIWPSMRGRGVHETPWAEQQFGRPWEAPK
jgi:hypothetical protein